MIAEVSCGLSSDVEALTGRVKLPGPEGGASETTVVTRVGRVGWSSRRCWAGRTGGEDPRALDVGRRISPKPGAGSKPCTPDLAGRARPNRSRKRTAQPASGTGSTQVPDRINPPTPPPQPSGTNRRGATARSRTSVEAGG